MEIARFLSDRMAMEAWIQEVAARAAENVDLYFNHRFHEKGLAIGTTTDERFGEFHLLQPGQVTMHVEWQDPAIDPRILLAETRPCHTTETLRECYRVFIDCASGRGIVA